VAEQSCDFERIYFDLSVKDCLVIGFLRVGSLSDLLFFETPGVGYFPPHIVLKKEIVCRNGNYLVVMSH